MIRLKKPAILSKSVGIICIDSTADKIIEDFQARSIREVLSSNQEQQVEVIGWGRTRAFDFTGDIQDFGVAETHLQTAPLIVVDNESCSQQLSRLPNGNGNVRDDDQLCAKGLFRNQDSCKGDSGGPLFLHGPNNSALIQVGIVSYGPTNCGQGLPGVYTRIEHFIEWIKRNLKV